MYTTLTEVAEVIARRFNDGRGRAFNTTTGKCLYRTCDGNRCVVGALLPDDFKFFNFQGSIKQLYAVAAGPIDRLFEHEAFDMRFLVSCQIVHDESSNWAKDGTLNPSGWREFLAACQQSEITLQPREHYVPDAN